jgi:hypothetical protein
MPNHPTVAQILMVHLLRTSELDNAWHAVLSHRFSAFTFKDSMTEGNMGGGLRPHVHHTRNISPHTVKFITPMDIAMKTHFFSAEGRNINTQML